MMKEKSVTKRKNVNMGQGRVPLACIINLRERKFMN